VRLNFSLARDNGLVSRSEVRGFPRDTTRFTIIKSLQHSHSFSEICLKLTIHSSTMIRKMSNISRTKEFVFPRNHHLVVVTKKHVLTLDDHGLRGIFASGSEGIMAAKEAPLGNGTLAIANSMIVLLHRIERGLDQSHRLKSTEV
jgi:hypothetical protein